MLEKLQIKEYTRGLARLLMVQSIIMGFPATHDNAFL